MLEIINKLKLLDKYAIVIFNDDGTTECFYRNMDLKDKALLKHEVELDIMDEFLRVNKGRWEDER